MKKSKKLFLLFSLVVVATILFSFKMKKEKESGLMLSDWITVHLKLIRTTKGVSHVGFSRHFSYTSIAFYEAVAAGNTKFNSLGGQLQDLPKLPRYDANETYVPAIGASAAYAEMLKYFYAENANAQLIDSLSEVKNDYFIIADYSPKSIQASSEFGKQLAKKIIEWAEGDGANQTSNYSSLASGEGIWQPTPPNFAKPAVPHWKNNKTLIKDCNDDVIQASLPMYSPDPSSPFFKMVREVYDVSQNLTEEQKAIAWFWDDSPNKYLTVSGHWSSILAQLIPAKKLPLEQSALAFVKCHIALHNAAIAAWQGKYTYMVIRPITFIQKHIDANWKPLIETPPHPEFPAAHATLSAAAAFGLTSTLGDNIAFTDGTYQDMGMKPRSFPSLNKAAAEAGISRLYGGIHYRPSIDEGLAIGKRVAENSLNKLSFEKSK